MGILLVRHADAVEAGGSLDDAARFLSAEGRTRARRAAAALSEKGLVLSRFVTSPRVRAVQTAELFASGLSFAGVIETLPSLCFTQPARDAAEALEGLRGHVAAFGHMPTIADIAARLTGGKTVKGLATNEAVWIDAGKVVFRVGADG